MDYSTPTGFYVNKDTDQCRTKFSYNSVGSVTRLLQPSNYLATLDISNAYRAVNIHPSCRERQGLSCDFGKTVTYLRDNQLCMGLSSSPYMFLKN